MKFYHIKWSLFRKLMPWKCGREDGDKPDAKIILKPMETKNYMDPHC